MTYGFNLVAGSADGPVRNEREARKIPGKLDEIGASCARGADEDVRAPSLGELVKLSQYK